MRTATTATIEASAIGKEATSNRSAILGLASVALVSIAVYFTTLFDFWVADDYNYIFPKGLDRVLAFFDPTVPSRAFYRPINWTSWAIDYALWGKSPPGWHLSNILVNTVACLAVALIAQRLFKSWTIALLAGALFAVHPAHPETVSFVGGRADEICGMFYFVGVLLFVIYLQQRARGRPATGIYVLSFVAGLAALLSKETGATLPLALLLTDAFFFTPAGKLLDFASWRNRIVPHLPFIVLVGGYALMRYYLIKSGTVTTTFSGPGLLSEQRLLDAAAGNVLLAVGVWNGPQAAEGLSNAAKALIVLAALAACGVAIRYVGRAAVYCLLWTALTILPTANLSSARWLYIPSFGICLLIALIVVKLAGALVASNPVRRNAAFALAGALMLLWAGGVLYENVRWYQSGEEAKSVLAQIKKLVPEPQQPTTIYFAGAPYYYYSALLFNTGLPSAMALIYDGQNVQLHEIEQPLADPVIVDALSNPPKLRPNPVFLGYHRGKVYSYPSLQALLQAGIGKQ